ncbi:methyltransferase domain-containing protein [Corallococcus sp. M34]|uniref:methyltransferase family protein n=1 Tax=Citreicoccus inhibens TaxID=2849499 RepID=UPI001C22723D|nr:class I SAM-dependent methyltransferase [Citreicoccus inhibens]MBU8894134.1 methyltransferase domain-containing protein [Citreicoccus inhibens]
MSEPAASAPPPDFVRRLNFWARDASNESAALLAAPALGLFAHLPDEGSAPVSLETLAARSGSKPRGVRAVVEPMVALGFVCFTPGQGYALAARAAFLRAPDFLARLERARRFWTQTPRLADALRTGTESELVAWFREAFASVGPATEGSSEDYEDRAVRNSLRTQALMAASRLGLLGRLSTGPGTLEALAHVTEARPESLRVLLDVLATMGIVATSGAEFRFTPDAARMLDAEGLPYFERALPATQAYWEALGHLDEAVREARFRLDLRDPEVARRIYQENASRISGIFKSHLRLSRQAAALALRMRSLEGATVLDVGTGSGVWGAAFGLVDPSTQVTYLDSPHVLDAVKPHLARFKLEARSRLWAGDCLTVELEPSAYDVILLPQIIPALPAPELPHFFARMARALKPRGLLLISGYLLTDRRDGPLDALYFALRRYVSNEGDVLSLPEFRAHLEPVGLGACRAFDMPIQQVVIAHRGDVPWPDAG